MTKNIAAILKPNIKKLGQKIDIKRGGVKVTINVWMRPNLVFFLLSPSARKSNKPKETPKQLVVMATSEKALIAQFTHLSGNSISRSVINSFKLFP